MEINKKWNDYKVCLCGQFGVGKTTIFQKVAEIFGGSVGYASKGDFAYSIDDPDLGLKKVRTTPLSLGEYRCLEGDPGLQL